MAYLTKEEWAHVVKKTKESTFFNWRGMSDADWAGLKRREEAKKDMWGSPIKR